MRARNSLKRKIFNIQEPGAIEEDSGLFTWHLRDKRIVETEIKMLVDRGAKLFFIFTGSASEVYNYESQFSDSMPFLENYDDRFKVLLNKNADHTFSLYHDRLWLYDKVLRWLDSV